MKIRLCASLLEESWLDSGALWAIGAGNDEGRVLRAANIITDVKLHGSNRPVPTTDYNCQCPDHRYSFDRDGIGWLCKHILAVKMDMRLNGEEVDW